VPCSVAATFLVNLLVTSPIVGLLSDTFENYIRKNLITDIRTLEPIFRDHYQEVIGAQAADKPGRTCLPSQLPGLGVEIQHVL
jgi:hypothetical protein